MVILDTVDDGDGTELEFSSADGLYAVVGADGEEDDPCGGGQGLPKSQLDWQTSG